MAKELLGQFLIRRGKVKQQDIDEALMLQEVLHDSRAAAALAKEMITFKDVEKILEYMDRNKISFTSAALKLKLLDNHQVEELRSAGDFQFRLGQLLLATTKLSRDELDEELTHFSVGRLLIPSQNVTKENLVSRIAAGDLLGKGVVKSVLEAILETISEEMARGSKVMLKGFGAFSITEYPARRGRNPKTGKPIFIPPKRMATLHYAKKFRSYVDKGRV
jgi:nucleoid DNA-binding protein